MPKTRKLTRLIVGFILFAALIAFLTAARIKRTEESAPCPNCGQGLFYENDRYFCDRCGYST